ncbi:MAG: 9-O-acetylesterase [Bacteroidetes bacterium]|nr:9-O-acetylesterase [Bacteroidota bacterium]
MRTTFFLLLLLVLVLGLGNAPSSPSLTVNKLFTSGAVLQRDTVVPIWGTAPAGEPVTVFLDEKEYSTDTTPTGTWSISLDPHPAGGPHTLTITSGNEELVAHNIVFGDVWIASGQSNMEWSVEASADAASEIASANDSLLRHYNVPRSWSYSPVDTLSGGQWHSASPEHVASFTAVGYSFARELRTHQNIPIGIFNTTWGGSRIEAWMDTNALEIDPADVMDILEAAQTREDSLIKVLTETHGASIIDDAGFESDQPIWASAQLDDSDWMEIEVPGSWEAGGLEAVNGTVWYRHSFDLTEIPTNAVIHLGLVDDQDMTWINGALVGQTDEFLVDRQYPVEEGILSRGVNQITIRVRDLWGDGGLVGADSKLSLQWPEGELDLEGTWKIRVGQLEIEPEGSPNQLPTLLYNAMVHPILNFPITGFIWYQGEANANNSIEAIKYADQFQSMITQWRQQFSHEDAPFLFVSLASYQAADPHPQESDWALIRESQAAALNLPYTGQAITLDIGDANDIHPKNKQDVGYRLSLWARRLAYAEDIVYSGPVYRDHTINNGMIRIEFDYIGSGLTSRQNDALGGFAIAGNDGHYEWANAIIEGESVIVSHPDIINPVAVRYAWSNNPANANLINSEGLPAASFRTDR